MSDDRVKRVSIHAPGRGATRTQPHIDIEVRVSIHAPGRGATLSSYLRRKASPVSIHAPGRGATKKDAIIEEFNEFQFTHPGGVRL